MRAAKSLGHQYLDRAADQFIPTEAEQILCLAVHLSHDAVSVDDHDCVRCGFEKPVKEF